MDMAQTVFCHKDSVLPNYFAIPDMYELKLAILKALS